MFLGSPTGGGTTQLDSEGSEEMIKLWKVSGGGLFSMLSTSSVQASGSVPVSMLLYGPPLMDVETEVATVVEPRDDVRDDAVGDSEARREVRTVRLSVRPGCRTSSSSRSESGPPTSSYSDWLSRARLEPGVGPRPRELERREREEEEAREEAGCRRVGDSWAVCCCCEGRAPASPPPAEGSARCHTIIWLS